MDFGLRIHTALVCIKLQILIFNDKDEPHLKYNIWFLCIQKKGNDGKEIMQTSSISHSMQEKLTPKRKLIFFCKLESSFKMIGSQTRLCLKYLYLLVFEERLDARS